MSDKDAQAGGPGMRQAAHGRQEWLAPMECIVTVDVLETANRANPGTDGPGSTNRS